MPLKEYQSKRNFARTAEPRGPRGRQRSRGSASAPPVFVIQKHAARRLHYDFRLEMDGTLRSWAVPKGIPTARGEKRLAMEVEDHPVEYGTFEGTIPQGSYGAGSVMLWDNGTYETAEETPAGAWAKGKLVVRLHGKKLDGEWTLVRIRSKAEAGKPWLLVKTGGSTRPVSARNEDRSVVSGKTMKQIARAGDLEADKPVRTVKARRSSSAPSRSTGARGGRKAAPTAGAAADDELARRLGSRSLPRAAPGFVEPMKARLTEALPRGSGWSFEVKVDGIRAIGIKNGQEVQLMSRRPRNLTAAYPEVAAALRELPGQQLVVDGELAALDAEGRSSFQLLQNVGSSTRGRPPILLYVFDLIQYGGMDLKGLPLTERQAALAQLMHRVRPPLRLSAPLQGKPERIWREIRRLGLEGLIAKRQDSVYQAGRRSGAWLKIKSHREQEFVIGGYTAPQGTRKHFGALLVGYYAEGKLLFAGKVGTGFDSRGLKDLHDRFQEVRTAACPFANVPVRRKGRWGQGLTAGEMQRCVWLEPQLVAQVRFMEWTGDGNLRHPVFMGLREAGTARRTVRR